MKTKPATENLILGALCAGPMHGYDLMLFLKKHLGGIWYVGTSQLYALLKRLDNEALIRGAKEVQSDRPAKRTHELTDLGKNHFFTWLNQPISHIRDLRIEFLTKLFFIGHYRLDCGDAIVERQIHFLKVRLDDIIRRDHSNGGSFGNLVESVKKSTITHWIHWIESEARPYVHPFSRS